MTKLKTAIVTGATSGIGEAFSKYLLDRDYQVIGIGRDFSKSKINSDNFIHSIFDLADVEEIESYARSICGSYTINLLVNCAGVGFYGSHDSINDEDIIEMINVNFTAAALMSRAVIPHLRDTKGQIVFVSSVSSLSPSRLGACYGATKAAINHLSRSLFEEVRKSGIKVSNLILDMTKTSFHDESWFGPSSELGAALDVDDTTRALDFILLQREGAVINEVVIRPQLNLIDKK